MPKFQQYLFLCLIFISACGQRDTVKDFIQPTRMADAYGDGRYVIRKFDMSVSADGFDSPMRTLDKYGIGYVAGGLAKVFMNSVASLGMGRNKVTLYQPLPELPDEYLVSAKLSRLFFYIEPKDRTYSRNPTLYQRFIRGRGKTDFDFIRKLAIILKPSMIPADEPRDGYSTIVVPSEKTIFSSSDADRFFNLFKRQDVFTQMVDLENSDDLVMVGYESEKPEKYINNNDYGSIYMILTRDTARTKHFLQDHSLIRNHIKKFQIMTDSNPETPDTLMVQLNKDVIANDMFIEFMEKEQAAIAAMDIEIEKCTIKTCIDLKMPDVNLLPYLKRKEALKIDAFIDAGKLPEEFNLKGMIEIEVKIDLPWEKQKT